MRLLLAVMTSVLLSCGGCGAAGLTGQGCTQHQSCAALEHGYCSRAGICTRECSEALPCEAGATCFDAGRRAVCLPTCERDDDCPATFGCRGGVCQVDDALASP